MKIRRMQVKAIKEKLWQLAQVIKHVPLAKSKDVPPVEILGKGNETDSEYARQLNAELERRG